MQKSKNKKTTGTAVEKQVKKKKNWLKYIIRVIGKNHVTKF